MKENRFEAHFEYLKKIFSSDLPCRSSQSQMTKVCRNWDQRVPDSEKTPTVLAMPKDSLIGAIRSCDVTDVANLKMRKKEYPPPSILSLRVPLVSQMIPKRARVQHVPRSAVGRSVAAKCRLARCISSAAYPTATASSCECERAASM